jgi:hypothetical protein
VAEKRQYCANPAANANQIYRLAEFELTITNAKTRIPEKEQVRPYSDVAVSLGSHLMAGPD